MDRGVIATAQELFDARHYPSVVALATDALEQESDCIELLVLRARAHHALRRDLDAQSDLRDVIRVDPQCGIAYRLLGELAARRDENESAAIFFREAVRLDPDDRQAREWLQIVDLSLRPATRFTPARAPYERARSEPSQRTLSSPARRTESQPQLRFARGTKPPHEVWKTPEPVRVIPPPLPAPRPATHAPMSSRIHELPGFGDYLVATGILTRERLRAAQAYQRSMKVQLTTAIVTLGLATPQRIEWAAVSHQSELAQHR